MERKKMSSISYIEEQTGKTIQYDGSNHPNIPCVGHSIMIMIPHDGKVEYTVKKVTHDSGNLHVIVCRSS